MAKTSFYEPHELAALGLGGYGKNVRISRFCRIYCPENVIIGDNVRIDDFCILSAGKSIRIGSYVHIGCHTTIIGAAEVVISDYCNVSGRVSIYSSSDDYSGKWMTNPMVPERFTNVVDQPVVLEKHVIVGCGSVLLPGVRLHEGVAIGAMSFVKKSCEAFGIYAGNPLRRVNSRSSRCVDIERKFLEEINGDQA